MDIETLMRMQRELYEKHRDTWDPLQPEYARNSLLWLVEEVGEVVAIFKKRGERETAQNPQLREAFLTEMSDVLMYFTDVLLRMGVSSEEFAAAYGKKHARNMAAIIAANTSTFCRSQVFVSGIAW